MPSRSRVIPEISQVQSEWIQEFSMAAVVLHVFAAMATCWNWESDAVKGLWIALREVEKRIVRRVQLSSPGECSLHRYGNPVPELHLLLLHVCRHMKGPLR